jgi:hypothetical protein
MISSTVFSFPIRAGSLFQGPEKDGSGSEERSRRGAPPFPSDVATQTPIRVAVSSVQPFVFTSLLAETRNTEFRSAKICAWLRNLCAGQI